MSVAIFYSGIPMGDDTSSEPFHMCGLRSQSTCLYTGDMGAKGQFSNALMDDGELASQFSIMGPKVSFVATCICGTVRGTQSLEQQGITPMLGSNRPVSSLRSRLVIDKAPRPTVRLATSAQVLRTSSKKEESSLGQMAPSKERFGAYVLRMQKKGIDAGSCRAKKYDPVRTAALPMYANAIDFVGSCTGDPAKRTSPNG